MFEIAKYDIEGDECAAIAEMYVVIDGGSADVHAYV